MNTKCKVIKKTKTGYNVGYSKSNCLVQGFNPELPAIIASPFVEKVLKDGKELGMTLYVYQDSLDRDGKIWEHQPIRVKVMGLKQGFSFGDKVIFDDLECVRIVTHSNNGGTISNYYYKANGVRLLKGSDDNA